MFFKGPETTTDTDNDNDLLQSTSTTRPSYPVNIIPSDHQIDNKSNQISTQHLLNTPNQITNDLNIYSTSVASGASIETLKPSNNLSSPSSSPVKQNDLSKSKPSSWADLFRSQTSANTQSSLSQQTTITTTTSPTKKSQHTSTSSSLTGSLSGAQISTIPQQNGNLTPKSTTNNFYSRTNYHVYNSNGGESKSLEGFQIKFHFFFNIKFFFFFTDYFSKCEVRPSAMAIKPRGLYNKNNYCYVNAVCILFFKSMKKHRM